MFLASQKALILPMPKNWSIVQGKVLPIGNFANLNRKPSPKAEGF